MQTLRFSETRTLPSDKIIRAKEKFVKKLTDAIQTENNVSSVIGSTKIDPDANLLLRFVKGVDKQYKTTANKLVLKQMLKEAASDLYRLQLEKNTGPLTTPVEQKYIHIGVHDGVIRPNVWPDDTDNYQWVFKDKFQSWSPIGEPGQYSISPGIPSGSVCLTYEDGTDSLRSNIVAIGPLIKRQVGVVKRKSFRFKEEDTEFISRCKSVASRILRLCNPRVRGTPFYSGGGDFSVRIFQDRVCRLPQHLDLDSREIIQLCYASDTDDDKFISMVEFCEPTIYLNPEGRRREIRNILAGKRVELRLANMDTQERPANSTVRRSQRLRRQELALEQASREQREAEQAEQAAERESENTAEQARKARLKQELAQRESQKASDTRAAAEKKTAEAAEKARQENIELVKRRQEQERILEDQIQAEQDAERALNEKTAEDLRLKAERIKQAAMVAKEETEKAERDALAEEEKLKKARKKEEKLEREEKKRRKEAEEAKREQEKLASEAEEAKREQEKLASEAEEAKREQENLAIRTKWDNQIRKLTKIKQALIVQKFKGLDTNGNGEISRTELVDAYESSKVKARAVWKILDRFDDNRNDNIDMDEFKYWVIDSKAINYWIKNKEDGYHTPPQPIQRPSNGQTVIYSGMKGKWVRYGPKNEKNKFEPKDVQNKDIDESGDDEQLVLTINTYKKRGMLKIKDASETDASGTDAFETDASGTDAPETKENSPKPRRSARIAGQPAEVDDLEAAIISMQTQIPSGDLTSMVANMSDDWAESDEELNFAEDSDTGDTGSMEFAESSQQEDSGSMEFAESSSLETDSDAELPRVHSSTHSSALEFAESSAVDSESDKVSSEAAFAESSDYD
jgi:hypothetical protein